MARLTDKQDACGHLMYDSACGKGAYEVDERDDGFVGIVASPRLYIPPYKDWPKHQKAGLRLARGKVLDLGCGPGRVALHLQEKGLDVLGIDVSPLAIKACKLRGVKKAKVMSVTEVTPKLGAFDTFVMYGNNFGLFGNFKRARWLLRRFSGVMKEGGRIIAESTDPYRTDEPVHLAYHKRNLRRGRMAGQLRLRIRYLTYATPWFDYLLASQEEMHAIVEGTGWRIARIFDSEGPQYVAVIEKE